MYTTVTCTSTYVCTLDEYIYMNPESEKVCFLTHWFFL